MIYDEIKYLPLSEEEKLFIRLERRRVLPGAIIKAVIFTLLFVVSSVLLYWKYSNSGSILNIIRDTSSGTLIGWSLAYVMIVYFCAIWVFEIYSILTKPYGQKVVLQGYFQETENDDGETEFFLNGKSTYYTGRPTIKQLQPVLQAIDKAATHEWMTICVAENFGLLLGAELHGIDGATKIPLADCYVPLTEAEKETVIQDIKARAKGLHGVLFRLIAIVIAMSLLAAVVLYYDWFGIKLTGLRGASGLIYAIVGGILVLFCLGLVDTIWKARNPVVADKKYTIKDAVFEEYDDYACFAVGPARVYFRASLVNPDVHSVLSKLSRGDKVMLSATEKGGTIFSIKAI